MRNAGLLSTVAVALLLGVGAASAQAVKTDEAPARAPAALQNAPAEKLAPAMKAGEPKAKETTGQAAPKELAPGHGQSLDPRTGMKDSYDTNSKPKEAPR